MKHLFVRSLAFAILVAGAVAAVAGAGPIILDRSFSGDGIVLTDLGGTSDFATGVERQPDGKLVVGGNTNQGSDWALGVARYHADGSLDTSFGIGGTVVTNVGPGQDLINDLVLQPDGKIVGVGDSSTDSNNFGFVRYTADGELDPAFEGGGLTRVTFSLPSASSNELAYGIGLQPDGKIIGVGVHTATGGSGTQNFAVSRLNADGSLDSTFDGDGKVITDVTGTTDWARAVAVHDDKILVAGYGGVNGSEDVALVRYNANGSLDSSFGDGGKVVTNASGLDLGLALDVLSDGRILVAGSTSVGFGAANGLVLRYLPDGTLDSSFGGDGSVVVDMGSTSETFESVTTDASGNVVVAGYSFQSGYDVAVARLTPDGALDTSFDGDGKRLVGFGAARSDQASDAVVQPNGAIVVAGSSHLTGPGRDFAVARLDVDREPPVLRLLSGVAADATSPSGAYVSYSVTATDNVAVASVTCSPPSGALFAAGDTVVSCTAVDTTGNSANGTFVVHVRDTAEQTANLQTLVGTMDLQQGIENSLNAKLQNVHRALDAGDLDRACSLLDSFIAEVAAQSGSKLTVAQAELLTGVATNIKSALGCS